MLSADIQSYSRIRKATETLSPYETSAGCHLKAADCRCAGHRQHRRQAARRRTIAVWLLTGLQLLCALPLFGSVDVREHVCGVDVGTKEPEGPLPHLTPN